MWPPRKGALALSFAVAFASVASVSLVARDALAGSCDNPLVSACINSDTLWPHAGPSRFVGVGGTETTAEGRVGFGLLTTYQSRPIVLHVPSPGPGGTDEYAINDQVNTSFLFSYGVTSRLELGVAVPFTLGQGGSGLSGLTGGEGVRDTAIRDLRFGLAYAVVPRDREDRVWALTARLDTSAPTGDRAQFAGERAAVFVPSLAADYRRKRWFAAAEIGLRLRPTAELVGARVGSQASLGLGLGYDVLAKDRLAALVEARALPTFAEQRDDVLTASGLRSAGNGDHIVPAEWMLSVRSAPFAGRDVALQAGGGGAIPFGDAITAPRFRFVLGVSFAPRAVDSDGDGVRDAEDRCPSIAGPRTGDSPGCPEKPAETRPTPGAVP